jgi:hypothetical protein
MGEDDIRKYLSRQSSAEAPKAPVRAVTRRARPAAAAPPKTFQDFNATEIFCPRCRRAMPVRQRILLFLPDGDLYDYNCTGCGTSLGTRKAGRD